jgi:hypothetical protein
MSRFGGASVGSFTTTERGPPDRALVRKANACAEHPSVGAIGSISIDAPGAPSASAKKSDDKSARRVGTLRIALQSRPSGPLRASAHPYGQAARVGHQRLAPSEPRCHRALPGGDPGHHSPPCRQSGHYREAVP